MKRVAPRRTLAMDPLRDAPVVPVAVPDVVPLLVVPDTGTVIPRVAPDGGVAARDVDGGRPAPGGPRPRPVPKPLVTAAGRGTAPPPVGVVRPPGLAAETAPSPGRPPAALVRLVLGQEVVAPRRPALGRVLRRPVLGPTGALLVVRDAGRGVIRVAATDRTRLRGAVPGTLLPPDTGVAVGRPVGLAVPPRPPGVGRDGTGTPDAPLVVLRLARTSPPQGTVSQATVARRRLPLAVAPTVVVRGPVLVDAVDGVLVVRLVQEATLDAIDTAGTVRPMRPAHDVVGPGVGAIHGGRRVGEVPNIEVGVRVADGLGRVVAVAGAPVGETPRLGVGVLPTCPSHAATAGDLHVPSRPTGAIQPARGPDPVGRRPFGRAVAPEAVGRGTGLFAGRRAPPETEMGVPATVVRRVPTVDVAETDTVGEAAAVGLPPDVPVVGLPRVTGVTKVAALVTSVGAGPPVPGVGADRLLARMVAPVLVLGVDQVLLRGPPLVGPPGAVRPGPRRGPLLEVGAAARPT